MNIKYVIGTPRHRKHGLTSKTWMDEFDDYEEIKNWADDNHGISKVAIILLMY